MVLSAAGVVVFLSLPVWDCTAVAPIGAAPDDTQFVQVVPTLLTNANENNEVDGDAAALFAMSGLKCKRRSMGDHGSKSWLRSAASRLRDSLSARWYRTSKNAKGGNGVNFSVAVFISGLQDRLELVSKIEHLVVPLVDQGHKVDLFVRLVASGQQIGEPHKKHLGKGTYTNFSNVLDVLRAKTEECGGRLVHVELLDASEDVSKTVERGLAQNISRFAIYSPFDRNETKANTGRNVLRRLQSLQRLMHVAVDNGYYDYVLVTREDSYWVAPLELGSFGKLDTNSVYTKNCGQWGGVNDKGFLFGHEAAKRVLLWIYTDVLMPHKELDTRNAETFWKAFFELANVTSSSVNFEQLPFTDSSTETVNGSDIRCVRTECLSNWTGANSVEFPPVCTGD